MPECIPFKVNGGNFTAKATAPVTGCRFVAPSGNRTGGTALSTDLANVHQVAHAGAGIKPCGVAGNDAANGALLLVRAIPGEILPVTAGASITAGQEVQSDATGQAIPLAAGRPAGLAMSGAANGALAEIRLYA